MTPSRDQQNAWATQIMRASMALFCVEPRIAEEIHAGLAAALMWAQSIAPLPTAESVMLVQGLRDTARWIQSRDPVATNYLFCVQAADALEGKGSQP